jgi:hypothetical protein
MGHYAKINENNEVVNTIVATIDFIHKLPDSASYIKTSYNTREGVHYVADTNWTVVSDTQEKAQRKNYAEYGMVYDPEIDCFRYPQPYPSWTLNTASCVWEAPIPDPDPGNRYWDEENQQWISPDPVADEPAP